MAKDKKGTVKDIFEAIGKDMEMVHMNIQCECEKCGKKFVYHHSYPKGTMEPCLQGMLPKFCDECERHEKIR